MIVTVQLFDIHGHKQAGFTNPKFGGRDFIYLSISKMGS